MKTWSVVITKRARRDADRAPQRVERALLDWITAVESDGMPEVRKIPGYHDEPLRGDRGGNAP